MQFDREELLSLLSDASPALDRTSNIPGFDHFWFDGKYVYAYNGGLGVRLVLESNLNCGLPGKTLLDLIRTSALKEIDIEASKKGTVLKMGKSRINLVTMDAERKPWAFPTPSKKGPGQIKATLKLTEDVLAAFTKVSFVRRMGKVTQAIHNGVAVIPEKKTTDFYATDSASMARVSLDLVSDENLPNFIAPWGFVERFLTLATPNASLYYLDKCLIVEDDGVLVCSNLMEFPDYPDMPKTMDELDIPEVSVEVPSGLQSILDRVVILSGDPAAPILLTADGTTLTLEGKYRLGSLSEDLPFKTGRSAEGKFPAYLVRRGLVEAEEMAITTKLLVLRGKDKTSDFIYLVSTTHQPKPEPEVKVRAKKQVEELEDEEAPF